MYILEEVNKWKEFKCEICGLKFKSRRGLGKHVQQLSKNNPSGIHPDLKEYYRLYFVPGYFEGYSPSDRKIYMLCNPLNTGNFNYGDINLLGEIINIHFEYEPFYCGFGKMGRRAKESKAYNDIDNEQRSELIENINNHGLEPIIYIIKENITTQQGKDGEKILVPLIGRQNHPDPSLRGPLTNKNNGGDGVCSGEFSQKTRDQMSESRKGNKNRSDKWLITRKEDGHEIITEDFVTKCEELGLNKDRMYEVANGYQKSHRGYTCKNLTKRKAVGGDY